jgi:AraC-like DNA-binding protein
VRVERHETERAAWEVARREPRPELRPYLLGPPEGWRQVRGESGLMREVPIPGVPLILNAGTPWEVADPGGAFERRDSFTAGLHTAPAVVHSASSWECLEVRLTPLGARRVLGLPMHELANRTIGLDELLPGARELEERLRETRSWAVRLELVETFLVRRLAAAAPPPAEVEWSWRRLRRAGGRVSIGGLAAQLGWSQRRLVAAFREHVGLAPKAAARVLRFDRAVRALGSAQAGGIAAVAFECGYADQAHLNRDFRELAGVTPGAFLRSGLDSGGLAA